jgi:hypothetical protein
MEPTALELYHKSLENSASNELLKEGFYKIAKDVLKQEMIISNIGVHKKFQKFVLHLEKIMTHLRIDNQFRLACIKWKEETGIETIHHYEDISNWIKKKSKNY